MPKTFDPQCHALAVYFLSDLARTDAEINDLASTIQGAIENWMEEQDDNAEASALAAYDAMREKQLRAALKDGE
jgi:hypothetical protein